MKEHLYIACPQMSLFGHYCMDAVPVGEQILVNV